MTKRTETPARRAKRVRINEDDNEVQVIHVTNPESAPSIAARDYVKAAVASHPEAIQRIAIALAKEFVSSTAKLQQKSNTKTKLDSDTTFIPRSARVAFKLTAPPSLMETPEFKTLSTAMEEKNKEYSDFCKKSIASVAALVNEGMRKEITAMFRKGLFQLCSLLLIQQDPSRKIQPVDYFILYLLTDMDQSVFDSTYAKKTMLQVEYMNKINEDSDEPATQQTVEIPPEHHGHFLLLKPTMLQLINIVFVESIAHFNKRLKENETNKCLEKQATQFLTGAATAATAMEVDSEPSADPKILRDLVNKAVQAKTSKLQTELQKIRDSVKRQPAKNSSRGANSSSTKQSASSSNKNEEKQNNKDEKKNANNGKRKPSTPQKKQENLDARKGNDSQKGKKNKKQNSGTPSQKKKAKKQHTQSSQS